MLATAAIALPRVAVRRVGYSAVN